MAAKTGRNDPCPCGSGKKYKQCCLRKDEEAEQEAIAAFNHARQEENEKYLALAEASNAPIDLVHAGKLDEAEQAARDLLARYPEVHDGYDRLGMVFEARGDNKQAAHCYRQALAFIRQHPDQYGDGGLEALFLELIAKLDPPDP